MAADGTVCAAIGDATAPNAGFAALRCTSGLTVDLEAFQASNKLPSNPYDVVSDGGEGWYVSDGAANNVVHIDRTGKVTIVAYVPDLAASALGGRHGQGVPAGLTLGPDRTLFVALYGGAPFDGPPAAVVSLTPDAATRPGRVKPGWSRWCSPHSPGDDPDGWQVADMAEPQASGKGECAALRRAPTRPSWPVDKQP